MLAAVTTAGLFLLLVGGVWQLSRARLSGVEVKHSQLVSEDSTVFSGEDLRNPTRILEDRAKILNAITVLVEALVIVAATGMVVMMVPRQNIPVAFKAVAAMALAVGAALVARALYVRLGLYHPRLETMEDYKRTLAMAVDEAVADDFTAIHGSLASSRGDGIDEVAVGVLAAAKNEGSLHEVAEWGESVGIADAEEFESRATTLVEADLIEQDDDRLRIGEPLRGADETQIATVAASVLN